MKKTLLASALLFALCLPVSAETVHQTLKGTAAHKGDGSGAVESGLMETKVVDNAKVARVQGSMNQWGYVTYWKGQRTPPGAATVRIRVYNTGEPVAGYAVYVSGGPNEPYGKVSIPADAPANSFVDINIPVALAKESSGIILKKTTKDDLPGPWIDSVSVILE